MPENYPSLPPGEKYFLLTSPSIEPWLAMTTHVACAAYSSRTTQYRGPENDPQLAAAAPHASFPGLDARELPLSAAGGEVFSLDIPFYRTRLARATRPPIQNIIKTWIA